MNLGDLLPSTHLLTKPWTLFEGQPGHPWVQSVARNLGDLTFGSGVAQDVNQKILGDPTQADLQQPNDTLNSPQNLALQKMLADWMQTQGQQQQTPGGT